MYTEDEAKTKWCPQVRFHGNYEHGGGDNRPVEGCGVQCLGSGCMMWRWAKGASVADSINGKRPGYCGLAGKPE